MGEFFFSKASIATFLVGSLLFQPSWVYAADTNEELVKQITWLFTHENEKANQFDKFSYVFDPIVHSESPGRGVYPVFIEAEGRFEVHLELSRSDIAIPSRIIEQLAKMKMVVGTEGVNKIGKSALDDLFSRRPTTNGDFLNFFNWFRALRVARQNTPEGRLAKAQLQLVDREAYVLGRTAHGDLSGLEPLRFAKPSKVDADAIARLTDRYFDLLSGEADKTEARVKILRKKFKALPDLNRLVAANDRKGVRRVIEAALPWERMNRQETFFWRNFVESITAPKKDVLLFRGFRDHDVPVGKGRRRYWLPSGWVNQQTHFFSVPAFRFERT